MNQGMIQQANQMQTINWGVIEVLLQVFETSFLASLSGSNYCTLYQNSDANRL